MHSQQEPRVRPHHPLTYVRAVRGWSDTDLRDVLVAAGLRRAVHTKVRRWERRGVVPLAPAQRVLAEVLGVPVRRLDTQPWPRWLPAFDGVRELSGWSVGSALLALDDAAAEDATDPRAFLALTGPPLVALGQGWLDATPTRLTAVIRGGLRVHEDTIGRIERHAATLRGLDEWLPAGTLGAVAHAQLRLLSALLAAGSFTAGVARRMFLVAADLAHLAGTAAFDAGHFFAAQVRLRAALHAAHAAGDRALGAYLVMCLAYQAVRLGEPRDAPRLTRIAVEGARGVPSARARALLDGHLLVIRAATGNRPVPRARHDLSPAPDDPAWSRWFTPPVSPFGLAHRPFTDAAGPPVRGRWEPESGPLPGSSQRRLHELAELMAIAGPDVIPEVRAAVNDLLA